MSERYEVREGNLYHPSDSSGTYNWVVRDTQEVETIITFWPECPDAEALARKVCAELNAAEAKKARENP